MKRRQIQALALAACALLFSACAKGVPANWARGGAALDVPRARWIVGTSVVDVFPDGRVTINDNQEMTIDRGGRVYDTNNDPVALLEPNGDVIGPGDKPLGNVGILHAAQPEEQHAWLSVLPTGEVVQYTSDGEKSSLGVWIGCQPTYSAHQTCTLVSHLLAQRLIASMRTPNAMMPGPYGFGPGYYPGVGAPYPWR